MAATIYLIRHGEVNDGDERRYNGHIDVPMSAQGVIHLKRLADYMVNKCVKTAGPLSAVYCSDLSRAVTSAGIIAGPMGLDPQMVPGLKEYSFGEWEGMTFREIEDRWPDAFSAWAGNPLRFSPPGGESTLQVRDRAMEAFSSIAARHTESNIAIVSHGGVIRIILCELLGIPLEHIFRIEQNFAALNIVEMWDYPVVKLMNFVTVQ